MIILCSFCKTILLNRLLLLGNNIGSWVWSELSNISNQETYSLLQERHLVVATLLGIIILRICCRGGYFWEHPHPDQHFNMASRKGSHQSRGNGDKYSVLLPTYNERENLPLIVWLLVKYFGERLVVVFLATLAVAQSEWQDL